MAYYTQEMIKMLKATQMLIGQVMLMIENQRLDTCLKLVEGPLAGAARKTNVALSTAEAEYMALASAAQEAIWLRQLNSELNHPSSSATVIHEDNQSAISIAKNPQFHGRAKHIEITISFYT